MRHSERFIAVGAAWEHSARVDVNDDEFGLGSAARYGEVLSIQRELNLGHL